MSKGSNQRPRQVSNDEYAQRWDAIFSRHEDESDKTSEESENETDADDNS